MLSQASARINYRSLHRNASALKKEAYINYFEFISFDVQHNVELSWSLQLDQDFSLNSLLDYFFPTFAIIKTGYIMLTATKRIVLLKASRTEILSIIICVTTSIDVGSIVNTLKTIASFL